MALPADLTKSFLLNRSALFPPAIMQEEAANENQEGEEQEKEGASNDNNHSSRRMMMLKRLPNFNLGIRVSVQCLARCVIIIINDIAADDELLPSLLSTQVAAAAGGEGGEKEQEQERKIVNLCQVPALGASVATVPRSTNQHGAGGEESVAVSSTTLLESATSNRVTLQNESNSSSGGSIQECIARSVAERLILRCQRNSHKQQQKTQQEEELQLTEQERKKVFLCDKLVIVHCGVALGNGIRPSEGIDFLSQALTSPLLAANIVKEISGLLGI